MKAKKVTFIITLILAIANLEFVHGQVIYELSKSGFKFQTPIRDINPVIGPLSPRCKNTMFHVITRPDFNKCIPFEALLNLGPLMVDPNIAKQIVDNPVKNLKPFIGPFTKFTTAICNAPRCSDEGVTANIEAIQDTCETDLSSNQLLQTLFDVTVFYPMIRDVLCFNDEQQQQFCWIQTIEKFISLPPSPVNITGDPFLDSIIVADTEEICTSCNKKIVDAFFNFMNNNNELALQILKSLGTNTDEIRDAVAIKCGIGFLSV